MIAPPSSITGLAPGAIVGHRFRLIRELGAGGMGVVWHAADLELQIPVALKFLREQRPAHILQFKDEFRSLAELRHHNLVRLYELFHTGEHWFFSMDLLQGCDFMIHVGRHSINPAVTPEETPTEQVVKAHEHHHHSRPASPCDVARLRAVLRDLAAGLDALHRAGKLHCDLKPSNVVVEPSGRAVLLDFGLVTEIGSVRRQHGGTLEYMAPERLDGRPPSPASDWYALGVMAYRALAGRLPSPRKGARNPDFGLGPLVPPCELAPDVPADLEELALALLADDPCARPSGTEVLHKLDGERGRTIPPAAPSIGLVGRDEELRQLDAALAGSRGQQHTELLAGVPGGGKTALAERFLDLARARGVQVLCGRCYERESIPYKGLDGLADDLAALLGGLDEGSRHRLLPPDAELLGRLFPPLAELGARSDAATGSDVRSIRQRAFTALRTLLIRLTERGPLVLFLDDLQWVDLDGVELLLELVGGADAPKLLLLGTHRPLGPAETVPLTGLLGGLRRLGPGRLHEASLGPLSGPAARALVRAALDDRAQGDLPDRLAEEAAGNPLFLRELAERARSKGDAGAAPRLEELLWGRIFELPAAARRLLEVVALAGTPLPLEVAATAAGLGAERVACIDTLRTARLLRAHGMAGRAGVECFHDRVREVVLGRLPDEERREGHLRLGEVLEQDPAADPEAVAMQLLGAGEVDRTVAFAERAAERAAAALAFDRAASLRTLVRDLAPTPERSARLGQALIDAGRLAEAAPPLLDACAGAPPLEQADLRRRAAEALLKSGRVQEGTDRMRDALTAVGIRLPRSPLRAFLIILWYRLRRRLRGLRFRLRAKDALPAEALARIDACWSASMGLALTDAMIGASFTARHLLLALEAGEPSRVARALATEVVLVGCQGRRNTRLIDALLAQLAELAAQVGQPYVLAWTPAARGISGFLLGDWPRGIEECRAAETVFASQCSGVRWEVTTCQTFALWSAVYRGDLALVCERVPVLLRDALERGDRFAANDFRNGLLNLVWLAADDPAGASAEIDQAAAQWSAHGFQLQHYYTLLARTQVDLYLGHGGRAVTRLEEHWKAIARSMMLRLLQGVRIEARHLFARCLLADPGGRISRVQGLARSLRREKVPWATALAQLLDAGCAARTGQHDLAIALLERGEAMCLEASTDLYAMAARRVRGELLGSHEGRHLVEETDVWMRSRAIVAPHRFARVLVPGALS